MGASPEGERKLAQVPEVGRGKRDREVQGEKWKTPWSSKGVG